MTIPDIISHYNLQPHPEGGWYAQSYRSTESIPAAALPERFTGDRLFSTAIYFLLEQGNFSAFHRIKSDECWHFYQGDPLEVFIIGTDRQLTIVTLGQDSSRGQLFQYVVPANCWFASRPAKESKFCFVGCTVAPGFDFADFELATAEMLCNLYPRHKSLIQELCR
ncbi:MAG: cupin domain-containing protein [Chitinophagaceae bacterium]|nr:cupin domain-containing protein [Chitinophagaceae bacterium]